MKTQTVLIADDMQANLDLLKHYLETSSGKYTILEATDGRTTCKIAYKEQPDLIIMDWEMPVMNGIEALKHLKKNPTTAGIPIIIATALTHSQHLKLALEQGASDYIRKPIDKVELLARVRTTLALQGSVDEIALKNKILEDQQSELIQQNLLLQQANGIIQEQKQEIEHKNKNLTDSIRYAQSIQSALMPSVSLLRDTFPDAFVTYLPKDIVSGDFFWFTQIGEKKLLAVADCTGHGVPAGFMSVLGITLLNDLVNARRITKPGLIIEKLHAAIRQVLHKQHRQNNDGMDIAIVAIHSEKKELTYAGANTPLLYIENKEHKKQEGAYFSIGDHTDEDKQHVLEHTLSIQNVSWIYLFSDGFQDQFGGVHGIKYMSRNFYNLLQRNHHREGAEQDAVLRKELRSWKENEEQLDDILIVGIQLN